jgi:hypothetical protein
MSENISFKSVLTDSLIGLINSFGESGFNPPVHIDVDQTIFDKLLA